MPECLIQFPDSWFVPFVKLKEVKRIAIKGIF